ncbi:hypothetical protein [Haloarchaeobius iranensis]|uniref:Uncharacterized protein n=1 Tax=Haloarchaeobius iranensis TaxID=996166 RepID=A0A1H0A4D1_9EURY|nr:hypothetical protein [Haloarchaeobius iranensis]SDN27823.1 hypothetical protein SAMN05192554_12426 [Haloarchaeobius iranensis]
MSDYGRERYRFGLAATSVADSDSGSGSGYEHWFENQQFAALARPSDSTFQITIDPGNLESMARLQVVSFREELLHGRRQRFGLMRNVRLLKREAGRLVYDALKGRHDPDDALATARAYYDTIETLFGQVRYPLEQVDKFLAYSLLEDDAHIQDEIDVLVADRDAPASARRTIEQAVDSVDLDAQTPDSADHIYAELVSIASEYNRLTAEAVANAALDIPYLVAPVTRAAFETRPVEEIDIDSRLDQAVEALSELETRDRLSNPASTTRSRLFGELKSVMNEPSALGQARTLREIALPLLDLPLRATQSDDGEQRSWQLWEEHSDPLSRLVHGGFSFPGGFGGAVYQLPDGARRWLVNPAIRNQPVEWRGDTWQYHRVWQHAYVLDSIIRQLVSTPTRIECPLCRQTTGGNCGVDGCGASMYIDNARLLGARHAV